MFSQQQQPMYNVYCQKCECTDLNKPKYNTLKHSVKNIQLAIGNLQFLPVEIEQYVRTDPVLQQKIEQTVTKKLNVPSKNVIYKDLVSTEAPVAATVQSVKEFQRKISARLPRPKLKDTEPNILDFNKPTFSRIKPQLPDPPPKPQACDMKMRILVENSCTCCICTT